MFVLLLLAAAQAATPTDIADTMRLSLLDDDASLLVSMFPPEDVYMRTCMSMLGQKSTCSFMRERGELTVKKKFKEVQRVMNERKIKPKKADYNGITPTSVPVAPLRLQTVNWSMTHKQSTLNIELHLLRDEKSTYLQFFKVVQAE